MRTVEWQSGRVKMIDQRHLPWNLTHLEFDDYRDVAQAITDMVVRGAPAIGATGAFGMALAAVQCPTQIMGSALEYLDIAAVILKKARPTAVNLSWGVDRMLHVAKEDVYRNTREMVEAMVAEACKIADEDVLINQKMGKHGAALIRDGDTVVHHCNTGALACVDYGTALGVIRTAYEQGKKFHVLLTETRPRMQGGRLSAWELHQLGQPFEVIPDSSAGYYMRKGEVKLVLVGADRVAANGDTINKVGTYMLSVLAKENNIPFYTVSPTSTIDLKMPTGDQVPIEERSADEVRKPYGNPLIPDDYAVRNPAFDVTPQRYLAGIVTEYGIALPPFKESLPRMVAANGSSK
jgi:methylthioribose-1-phosphate isomerase